MGSRGRQNLEVGGRAQGKEIKLGSQGHWTPNYLYLTGNTSGADPAPRGKAHTGNLDGEGKYRKQNTFFWHSAAPILPLAKGSPIERSLLVSDQSNWSLFPPWKSWCKKREIERVEYGEKKRNPPPPTFVLDWFDNRASLLQEYH